MYLVFINYMTYQFALSLHLDCHGITIVTHCHIYPIAHYYGILFGIIEIVECDDSRVVTDFNVYRIHQSY